MAIAKNVGMFDRLVRAVLGTALVFYGILYLVGLPSVVSVFFGLVFVLTALTASCPLYALFGITTHRRSAPKPLMAREEPLIKMERPPMVEEIKPKKPRKKARKRRRKKSK